MDNTESYYCYEYKKCRDSYEYFIDNYLKLNLRDYQNHYLYRLHNYRNNILLAPRRSGKDYTILPYLLWYALFHSNKNIVIVGHSWGATKILLERINTIIDEFTKDGTYEFISMLPYRIKNAYDGRIEFSNGSKIRISNGSSYRSDDIDILYLSEFAFSDKAKNIFDCHYIIMSKRQYAKIIIASSASSTSSEFYKQWNKALKGTTIFIPTKWDIKDTFNFVCDDFDKFKQDTIADIGQENWETEFECNFREDVKPEIQQKLPTKETVMKELDQLLLDYLHGRLS